MAPTPWRGAIAAPEKRSSRFVVSRHFVTHSLPIHAIMGLWTSQGPNPVPTPLPSGGPTSYRTQFHPGLDVSETHAHRQLDACTAQDRASQISSPVTS